MVFASLTVGLLVDAAIWWYGRLARGPMAEHAADGDYTVHIMACKSRSNFGEPADVISR